MLDLIEGPYIGLRESKGKKIISILKYQVNTMEKLMK